MARFAQYAMVASEEALKDAGWEPKTEEELEATVYSLPVYFSIDTDGF
jgi:3-oxoacyl-[acyl-carrier-protein] synthase II